MDDNTQSRQKWIMHAYDEFVCGHDILYLSPDGNLFVAVMIQPNHWHTNYRFTGWSTMTTSLEIFELDEYQDVLIVGDPEPPTDRSE